MLTNKQYFTEVARKGVPNMHPLSLEYKLWWKEQKNRCLYGYKVGDTYMPGRLYWYVNFWTIELNKKGNTRKSKGRPELRDVEWLIAEALEKCRGFTGLDSSNRPVYDKTKIKGLMLMAGRGSGKSFSIAGMGPGYEFTFFPDNEIVVSAHVTDYSLPHLQKVKLGLDNLVGDTELGGILYPSPFKHNRLKNNWNDEVRSGYQEKIGGNWVTKGYNSRIYQRVYKDNPTASNGLRPSFQVMEEIGMWPGLTSSYNNTIECWMDGTEQFGTPVLIGTGGDMDKGTVDASKMFYEGDAYNLLTFEDTYEQRGKVGLFIPAWMGDNGCKDEEGNTIKEVAIKKYETRREQKRKASDKRAYYSELQNQPLVPSEMFLTKKGNLFPTADLTEQLAEVTTNRKLATMGLVGELVIDPVTSSIKFKLNEYLQPADYPVQGESEGAIVIWEPPEKDSPFGLYIAGIDPYDQDRAESSSSLGSCLIYKRFISPEKTHDLIVAEYTARPKTANEFYENVRRLLMYYNARALYENQLKGLKQYMETKASLHYLKEQPSILKEIVPNSKVERGYGIHMNAEIKAYGERLINQWLMEEKSPGVSNICSIYSAPLLKELIAYNEDGNFDRVIALMLVMIHKLDNHAATIKEKEEQIYSDPFWGKKLFQRK